MDAVYWLLIANMIIWAGIGSYLVFMAIRQKQADLLLKRLESLRNDG